MAKAEGTRYLDCGFMVYTKREYRAMDTRFDGYGREVLTKGRTGFGLGTQGIQTIKGESSERGTGCLVQ